LATIAVMKVKLEDLKGVNPERAIELGEILAGNRSAVRSKDQIAVYKSTGHAVEDAAAARLVYELALARNVGELVTL